MNYDWSIRDYCAMCYTWIKQAQIWLDKEDLCVIFSKKPLPRFLIEAMKQSTTCRFKSCVREGFDCRIVFPGNSLVEKRSSSENVSYKLYISCNINFPFIFIDSDAFIVGSLSEVKSILDSDRKVVFIDHETNLKDTKDFPLFINSGFFINNDVEKSILNWGYLYEYAKKRGFIFKFKNGKTIPGTDQSLIKSYLDYIGYKYNSETIDTKYNSFAGSVTKIEKINNLWKCYKDEAEIKVIHFWSSYKPWEIGCPIFGETINDKMFNSNFIVE
jgi:hypothetical protein